MRALSAVAPFSLTSLARLVPLAGAASLAACSLFSSSPATHSPLKERLAASDTGRIEDAARACLTKSGWKVDPVGGTSAGANVVTAAKAKEDTTVYIQPPEVSPRVTGGPDYGDTFWSCLGGELSGTASPASAGSAADSEPETEAKPADTKPKSEKK